MLHLHPMPILLELAVSGTMLILGSVAPGTVVFIFYFFDNSIIITIGKGRFEL
jgi:hypothetical protein